MSSRGQQLQARLQSSNAALHAAHAELLQTAEQRRQLEHEMQLIARAGGIGLWDWDLPTDTVHFSKEWKRQLGYGEHELDDVSHEWRRRLHPDDRERVNSALQRYVQQPAGEFSIETRLLHRDGSYRWILSQATVLLDETGKSIRMLGSHVDITTRKQAEFALRESEARYRALVDELELRVAERTTDLMEAYRESRSFAYAVAHDLKAPLRAIDSFSHLLHESAQAKLNETELGLIGRVRRSAIHMASLIEGLLDYSRMEHLEVRIELVPLRAFFAEVLEPLQEEIDQCKAEIRITVPAVSVRADRQGLAVVARNLLENALKFSRATSTPQIEIGAQPGGQTVVIWIKDNGIGFEQIYHEKIFEIFQRLHRSDAYEGTGIGLALARKAMQRMRGRIWAISAPGEGATFYLELPLAQALDSAVA
jgi:PAS domain S-box-containing protein